MCSGVACFTPVGVFLNLAGDFGLDLKFEISVRFDVKLKCHFYSKCYPILFIINVLFILKCTSGNHYLSLMS